MIGGICSTNDDGLDMDSSVMKGICGVYDRVHCSGDCNEGGDRNIYD